MSWHSVAPDGTKSVRQNRPLLGDNTTYIETTMGNEAVGTNTTSTRDHFWDVGSDEDGRHRFMQSPAFTVGGNPEDPVLGTGMDGVLYLKTVNSDIGRVEGFYRNTDGIYQYIPSFLQGTFVPTSSFTSMISVPKNVYGEIFMYMDTVNNQNSGQVGYFQSDGTTCRAWAYSMIIGSGGAGRNLEFANDSANVSGLNIRVSRVLAGSGITWQYRITYRAK